MSSIKFNSCIDLLHGTSHIVQHSNLDISTEHRNDLAEETDLLERNDSAEENVLTEGNVSAERNEPTERNVRKASAKNSQSIERYTSHYFSHFVYSFDELATSAKEKKQITNSY